MEFITAQILDVSGPLAVVLINTEQGPVASPVRLLATSAFATYPSTNWTVRDLCGHQPRTCVLIAPGTAQDLPVIEPLIGGTPLAAAMRDKLGAQLHPYTLTGQMPPAPLTTLAWMANLVDSLLVCMVLMAALIAMLIRHAQVMEERRQAGPVGFFGRIGRVIAPVGLGRPITWDRSPKTPPTEQRPAP